MFRRIITILFVLPRLAQCGPTLIGAVYGLPAGISVVPGQIIRLEATGLQTLLPTDPTCCSTNTRLEKATSLPLPDSLFGISVTIIQTFTRDHVPISTVSYKAPILSIEQSSSCNGSWLATSPDCFVSFITAQIPFEVTPLDTSNASPLTGILISENGTDSQAFGVVASYDAIHVVTLCDRHQMPCQPVVTHSDGALVSSESPGTPGEVVTVYAWGLGRTTPMVKTGEATPEPAPVLGPPSTVAVEFDFRPNAGASNPHTITSTDAYLTPGEVGLYQINIQLPDPVPPVAECGSLPLPEDRVPMVPSNLTINLGGRASFDGAGICVTANRRVPAN